MSDLGEGFGSKPWTEAGLQRMLALKFNRSGSLCVPNCGAFGWESDLIRVTPRLISAEYEIKVTRADFRNDAKSKMWKHLCFEDPWARAERGLIPNHFWYVAPRGVIPPDEVPPYAGLIEIVGHDLVPRVKAPKVHDKKLKPDVLLFITRGAALRYWGSKFGGDTAAEAAATGGH